MCAKSYPQFSILTSVLRYSAQQQKGVWGKILIFPHKFIRIFFDRKISTGNPPYPFLYILLFPNFSEEKYMERIKTYKFRLYPTKKQEELLNHHLWLSKVLWNLLLQKEKEHYNETGEFIEKTELQKLTKNSGLFSQTAQAVCHRLYNAIMKMIRERKQGKNTGFPRFKNFFRVKSLYYPQAGFKLEEKLEVSPFGEIKIKKHREINGLIKTLTLKRSPSGKWFAMFVVYEQKKIPKQNNGPKTGLDFGLMNFATLSNGFTIPNPNHLIKHEQKLIFFQRRLSRKKKKSRNRNKARIRLANLHEKMKKLKTTFSAFETEQPQIEILKYNKKHEAGFSS